VLAKCGAALNMNSGSSTVKGCCLPVTVNAGELPY
jgi:hypothetical protein